MGPDDHADRQGGSSNDDSRTVTIGFIPLVDCALVVAAAEKGFAEDEGLRLSLVRETSWANIRDRAMLGHFDAAHMLAPLPIASTLGAGGHLQVPMVAPFSLGLGGNAITLSERIWSALEAEGARIDDDPATMVGHLARLVALRRTEGAPPLTLATVYPFSGHNYELRYWLASAGIDPDADVRLVVLPPPFMVDALADGQVDGFCVGEPWNSTAVDEGVGVIVATKSALWRQGPDKVLGLRRQFAKEHPERLKALIRALHRAATWASEPDHHGELAELLSRPAYVGGRPEVMLAALSGQITRRKGLAPKAIADFLVLHAHAANFPWQSHALWFYSQMVRWGQVPYRAEDLARVREVYRPDLYRAALQSTDADLPNASAKVEGALKAATPVASKSGRMVLGPDGFFDGRLFDPDDVEGYLKSLGVEF
ncbi:CmpA/NrtA family ABC transporter substrate-binding protein [Amorphus sp. 3PC139-8]|uniref:CmpA/NrtA family ABC transporter substrate-binding protein n=1 Tax=Amorphus sp. 3PC139-8 TaxID=2735676 RepID=UPI00345D6654